jgi:hypothetical protein
MGSASIYWLAWIGVSGCWRDSLGFAVSNSIQSEVHDATDESISPGSLDTKESCKQQGAVIR